MPLPCDGPIILNDDMQKKQVLGKFLYRGHLWARSLSKAGLLTSTETSNMLGITRRHLYRLVDKTTIHPLRRGHHLYFRVSEVLELKKQRVQGRASRRNTDGERR